MFFPSRLALAVALVVAGGALAAPGGGRVHSLIPSFVPRPDAWLQALVKFPQNPTPSAAARSEHGTEARSLVPSLS